jgi:hypothetical protein
MRRHAYCTLHHTKGGVPGKLIEAGNRDIHVGCVESRRQETDVEKKVAQGLALAAVHQVIGQPAPEVAFRNGQVGPAATRGPAQREEVLVQQSDRVALPADEVFSEDVVKAEGASI